MQDLSGKVDGVSTLPASEWNQLAEECTNIIQANGQTPTSSTLVQILRSVSEYGNRGNFFVDTGVDGITYVLNTAFVAGNNPSSYKEGMRFSFVPAVTNVNAAPVINVGGLGAKSIVFPSGGIPAGA